MSVIDVKGLYEISSKISVFDLLVLQIIGNKFLTDMEVHLQIESGDELRVKTFNRTERCIERLLTQDLITYQHTPDRKEKFYLTKLGKNLMGVDDNEVVSSIENYFKENATV